MADTQARIGHGITFRMADVATPTSFTYIAEIGDVGLPSDDTDMVEATHMQSPNRDREYIFGLNEAGEVSFDMNLVPGSASDLALIAAKGKKKLCEITFPNGVQTLFVGLRQAYEKSAPVDDKMSASVNFKVSGTPTQTTPVAPINMVAPTISGTAQVGKALTLDPGIWGGATGLTYQWKKAGSNISGATGSSYVPVSGDIGSAITCTVTGDNGTFTTAVTTAGTSNVIA